MTRMNWDEIARQQFESLPRAEKEAWGDLRDITIHQA